MYCYFIYTLVNSISNIFTVTTYKHDQNIHSEVVPHIHLSYNLTSQKNVWRAVVVVMVVVVVVVDHK